jgi:hypothetical protein
MMGMSQRMLHLVYDAIQDTENLRKAGYDEETIKRITERAEQGNS